MTNMCIGMQDKHTREGKHAEHYHHYHPHRHRHRHRQQQQEQHWHWHNEDHYARSTIVIIIIIYGAVCDYDVWSAPILHLRIAHDSIMIELIALITDTSHSRNQARQCTTASACLAAYILLGLPCPALSCPVLPCPALFSPACLPAWAVSGSKALCATILSVCAWQSRRQTWTYKSNLLLSSRSALDKATTTTGWGIVLRVCVCGMRHKSCGSKLVILICALRVRHVCVHLCRIRTAATSLFSSLSVSLSLSRTVAAALLLLLLLTFAHWQFVVVVGVWLITYD